MRLSFSRIYTAKRKMFSALIFVFPWGGSAKKNGKKGLLKAFLKAPPDSFFPYVHANFIIIPCEKKNTVVIWKPDLIGTDFLARSV